MDRAAQISLCLLAALASAAALEATADIAAPTTLGLTVGLVLAPLAEALERRGLARGGAALAALTVALLAIGGILLLFQPILAQLFEQAPKVWSDLQDVLRALRGLASGLKDVSREVATTVNPGSPASAAPPEGAIAMPTVTDALLIAPAVGAQGLTFIGALFFFLLTRRELYIALPARLARPQARADLTARLFAAEALVSRYFGIITVINAALGAATGLWLTALGLPGALAWGALAFLVNYIIFLGPALLFVTLLFAGVAGFDGAAALLPALGYIGLNFLESQFVTPAFVGRRMEINPLGVFLALLFGIWLWGPIGGIVAIPLILWAMALWQEPAAQDG